MDTKHWKLAVDGDNLAWLTFDRAGAGRAGAWSCARQWREIGISSPVSKRII